MTDMASFRATLIYLEILSMARLKGVMNPSQHPHLWVILNRYSFQPDDAYRTVVGQFSQELMFDDRFVATEEQVRKALLHHMLGCGSLMDRRNEVVMTIFEIDTDARKGWENGSFRKNKERQLIMPFALYLARQFPQAEAA